MYEIDRVRIDRQLVYLANCKQVLEEVDYPLEQIEHFAMARAIHIAVECMIDVGSLIIDGFMMRDPGGYADIIDILSDEKVITFKQADCIKEWVRFRERLVRSYDELEDKEMYPFLDHAAQLHEFIQSIQAFLQRERVKGTLLV